MKFQSVEVSVTDRFQARYKMATHVSKEVFSSPARRGRCGGAGRPLTSLGMRGHAGACGTGRTGQAMDEGAGAREEGEAGAAAE